MEQCTLIEEYNALFVRFVRHIASLRFDRCLMGIEGKPYKFNTQGFLQADPNLQSELKQWPEWLELDKKVQEYGGAPLNHYFVFGYQFPDLLNSIKFVKTHTIPKFDNQLPHLDRIIHDGSILNNTLLSGEMSFRGTKKNRYVVLIQGLKLSSKLELEGYGYFDSVSSDIKEYSGFWYEDTPKHLYTAFYSEQESLLSNVFLCKLMTAIRTYQERDVRFDRVLTESTGVIGEPSYSPMQGVSYSEDTAIFGTKTPCLMEVSEQDAKAFTHHVADMLSGLVHMEVCCEYYNYSRVSPVHLQVPTAFIAVESIFQSNDRNKQELLAKLFSYLLDKDDSFGELIKKYYRLRNAIVHGNKVNERKICDQISSEHPNAPSINQILQSLFVVLAKRKWNPLEDIQELKKQLTRP